MPYFHASRRRMMRKAERLSCDFCSRPDIHAAIRLSDSLGEARWDIWREDQQAASGPARDAERYTFVIWDASDRYQSWLQRLIESEDARTDITVVLHESEDQVLRLLGSRPVLRLHCNRDMYECLFELVGVLVTPAMFQSIVGADPADFRHLSRFGGELRLFHACADQIETIVVRFTVFGKYADFPPSKVTGICLTVLVPLALPVVESIDALVLASHREGAVPDNVDVVLTAFAHREPGFFLTMLWIAGDDRSLEGA